MSEQIFVNLPVRDLARTAAFYSAIGAVRNPQFSDDTAACMVISDTIFLMLLTRAKRATFTSKPIVDAHRDSEVMLALSCDSRAEVDALSDAAGAAAGSADVNLKQDSGFMCGRSFEDVDGHIWEAICVDMSFHFHLIWRGLSKRQFTHFGKLRTGFDKLRACPGPDPGASGQHADSFRGEPVEPWAESAHGDRFA